MIHKDCLLHVPQRLELLILSNKAPILLETAPLTVFELWSAQIMLLITPFCNRAYVTFAEFVFKISLTHEKFTCAT